MKNKNFNKIACKFLLLLIIAVNMPLKLFAEAYDNGIFIIDPANGILYKHSNYTEESGLVVSYISDTTIVVLNIPSELTYRNQYYGERGVPYESTRKVTSISGIKYEISMPLQEFYPLYLQCINIPETVTSIDEGIFAPCYLRTSWGGDPIIYDDSHLAELMEINVHTDNPNYTSVDGVLYNKDKSVLIACPPARTECDIPASVTQIANYAFAGCRNLKSLTVPNSVTQIGSRAFEDCANLGTINLPESVTSIGDYAFKDCKSLASLNLPDALTSIGDYAFKDCEALASVDFLGSVDSIGDYAFAGCTSLKSLVIPAAQIGAHTFDGCANLEAVTLPEPMASIGDHAFKDCEALASMDFLGPVASIGDYALSGCTSLKSLVIPVARIGAHVFDGCANLEAVTFPEQVASIGDYAFKDCGSLASIDFPASLTSIGDDIFNGCGRLKEIRVAPGNGRFADVDGVLYDKDLYELRFCPNAVTECLIPPSVVIIGDNAFSGCASLASVNIPPSVQAIKSKAFMNCASLSEITLPASVEYIGEKTFSGCSSLLTINAMRMRPAETGSRAFEGVPIDAYVYVPKRTVPFYLASEPWSVFYYYFEVEEWVTGISNVTADAAAAPQDVHTLQGVCVKRDATEADIDALPRGLYIIGGKKVYVK